MASSPRRGARSAAAPLVLAATAVLGVAGCNGSAHHAATVTTPIGLNSSAPAPADPRAAQLVAKAESALAAERSYRFDATETVAAKTPVTTRVTGDVVRDQGVSYTLVAGKSTTQVVRIKAATYVRKLPGKWTRLAKPSPVTDPTTSLAALLRGLTGLKAVDATTVAGTLTATGANAAGIPNGSEPAQVTVTIDSAGHVTHVTVHTSTQAGAAPVAVTLDTAYSRFGAVRAITKPA